MLRIGQLITTTTGNHTPGTTVFDSMLMHGQPALESNRKKTGAVTPKPQSHKMESNSGEEAMRVE